MVRGAEGVCVTARLHALLVILIGVSCRRRALNVRRLVQRDVMASPAAVLPIYSVVLIEWCRLPAVVPVESLGADGTN